MTSKERVLAALQKRPADRVPIFMWFHPGTTRLLAAALDVQPRDVDAVLGNDVRQAWVGNNFAMEGITHENDGETHTDAWGITWVKEGSFNQILRSPLADADESGLDEYAFPHHAIGTLMGSMDPLVIMAREYFIGCDVSPCCFELLCRIRGMERTLEDFALQPGIAAGLLERAARFEIALAEEACARYPLDWLWTGDDVAGQHSLMISPRQWRALVAPPLARIVAVGKARGLPVAYHCCGAVRPIIEDLITMGVDVLNPIQCHCAGMDAADLKKSYGSRLAFMGGLDTVELLPRGTAEEVFDGTRRLIETMTADGGGFILAASHTVPPETPLKNIFAIYAAAGISSEEIFDRAAALRSR
jgi:uroporphyrinogen decarboxylase